MRSKKKKVRVKWRNGRAYGDFRDFADVGGKQEALIPPGDNRATTDPDEALNLANCRVKELKQLRRSGYVPGDDRDPALDDYAEYHLTAKATARRTTTVERDERSLSTVSKFFSEQLRMPGVRLSQITVERLTKFVAWRRVQPGRKGKTIAVQTMLHELHGLSNLYKRALVEGKATENPVHNMPDKMHVEREEAEYLESGEAARLLAAAKELDKELDEEGLRRGDPIRLHPLIATYLYTGGRPGEVPGLEVSDIDLRNGVVRFKPNAWRLLKRRWAKRNVPLWPDLKDILSQYIGDRTDGLLFPARDGKMIGDFRSRLDAAVVKAKTEKRVTPRTFRHTYTAARLQTTDNGKPISVWQVASELGHRNIAQIEETYGHLLNVRDRAPYVAYREAKVLRHEAPAWTG